MDQYAGKIVLVMNEQHSLLPEQEVLLGDKVGENELVEIKVPAEGWTIQQMESLIDDLITDPPLEVIFVSPVPYLIRKLAGIWSGRKVLLFHNDHREKKELPNGKIIFTVPQTGWKLV